MKCSKCGSENCQIVNEVHTSGKDFFASKGCCRGLILSRIGILCSDIGLTFIYYYFIIEFF